MPELNHGDMVALRFADHPSHLAIPQLTTGTMNGQEKQIPAPIPCERCGEQVWLVNVTADNGDHIIAVVERCTEYPPEEEVFWAHVCEVA